MKGQWDGMVTCFFMDTAPVVFEYVETIWSCLKAGGVWDNQGPLLYHWCVFTCFIILLSFPLCLSLCLTLSMSVCVCVCKCTFSLSPFWNSELLAFHKILCQLSLDEAKTKTPPPTAHDTFMQGNKSGLCE